MITPKPKRAFGKYDWFSWSYRLRSPLTDDEANG
jgi:hypothetical protein